MSTLSQEQFLCMNVVGEGAKSIQAALLHRQIDRLYRKLQEAACREIGNPWQQSAKGETREEVMSPTSKREQQSS